MVEQLVLAEDNELNTKLVLRCNHVDFNRYYGIYEVNTQNKKEQYIINYNVETIATSYKNSVRLLPDTVLVKVFGRYSPLESIDKFIYEEVLFNRRLKPIGTVDTDLLESEAANKTMTMLQNWLLNNINDTRVGYVRICNKQVIVVKSTAYFKSILVELGLGSDTMGVMKLLKANNKLMCNSENKYCVAYSKTLGDKAAKSLGLKGCTHVIIPIFEDDFINNFINKREVA